MLDAGLNVVPASDDPGMFPTSLAREYRIVSEQIGAGADQVRAMALAGVDASWLPTGEKAALRERFVAELAALDSQLGSELGVDAR